MKPFDEAADRSVKVLSSGATASGEKVLFAGVAAPFARVIAPVTWDIETPKVVKVYARRMAVRC